MKNSKITKGDITQDHCLLLVGRQEGHLACKNWVVGCWHGYLTTRQCDTWHSHACSAQSTHQAVVVSCVSDSKVSDANTLSIGSMATVTPQSSLLRQASSQWWESVTCYLITEYQKKKKMWWWVISPFYVFPVFDLSLLTLWINCCFLYLLFWSCGAFK